jgi:hypothetical protein
MGSGAVIYIPSFIKIGSGVQKLIGGYTDTHPQTPSISVTQSKGVRTPQL